MKIAVVILVKRSVANLVYSREHKSVLHMYIQNNDKSGFHKE